MSIDEATALADICERLYKTTFEEYKSYYMNLLEHSREYLELEEVYKKLIKTYNNGEPLLSCPLHHILSGIAYLKTYQKIKKEFVKDFFKQELLFKATPDLDWFKDKFIEEYFEPLTSKEC